MMLRFRVCMAQFLQGCTVPLLSRQSRSELSVRERILGGPCHLKDIVLHIFLGFFVGLFRSLQTSSMAAAIRVDWFSSCSSVRGPPMVLSSH